ncbi:MAG: Ig-like domain-containing protein [Pseudomonadota bacterium]
MLSFLLDERRILGRTGPRLAQGNAAPIAVDDPYTVTRGAGTVNLSVLDNDVDPEGQPLTLVSAFAALGTAVAETDGTVTYTPPPAPSVSADTVVYTIADVEGATDDGQIDITIVDPVVAITTLPDQTLEVSAGNLPIDITITAPAAFAGSYTADLTALGAGPIALVPPTITGSAAAGQLLTASEGLWIYDATAGVPSQGFQWQRGGVDIPGETGATYTFQTGDTGPGIAVVETLSDTNGSQQATSAALAQFQPDLDVDLLGWWDASDTATITQNASAVTEWANKATGPGLIQANGARQPTTGVRTLNGRNIIDFDGGDHLAQAITLPASGDMAFHMVLEIDSTLNAFEAILAVDATNDFQIDSNNSAQFDGRFNASGIGTTAGLTGGPFAGAMILSVICDLTGTGSVEIFINNVSRAVVSYTTAIDAAVDLHVMTNRSRNAWVNGAVGELIVTGALANRGAYHGYLAAKWGLS